MSTTTASHTTASAKPISPLRRRMIEDMTVRGFVEKTQSDYIRHVKNLSTFLVPSLPSATAEDLRSFQLHQRKTGVGPPTINSAVAAFRFFFNVTLERPDQGRLVSSKLVDYTLGLYASKGYVDANGLPATPEELKAHRRIGYVEDLIFTPSLNFTGEVMRDWNAGFEISSAIGQTEAVLAGAGIGILHSYIARQHESLVRVLPDITLRRAYWTTFHESARELVRVRAVVQFLQDAVEQDRAIFS